MANEIKFNKDDLVKVGLIGAAAIAWMIFLTMQNKQPAIVAHSDVATAGCGCSKGA